jgi:cell division protein ZapA
VQGREYHLRSQQDSAQVQKVVDFIDGQLAEVAQVGSVDSQDVLALTLLNLAGQYLQLREAARQADPNQDERLERLLLRVEEGLS